MSHSDTTVMPSVPGTPTTPPGAVGSTEAGMSPVASTDGVSTRRMPRSRGAASGFLLLVLGAWGALVPFIGPSFSFGFTPDRTWHWTAARGWLEVLPGGVAALAGLLLLVSASRAVTLVAAWLGMAAGAWFVVGRTVAPLMSLGSPGRPTASSQGLRVLEQLAYFEALGVVIAVIAAAGFGRLSVVSVRDLRAAQQRELLGSARQQRENREQQQWDQQMREEQLVQQQRRDERLRVPQGQPPNAPVMGTAGVGTPDPMGRPDTTPGTPDPMGRPDTTPGTPDPMGRPDTTPGTPDPMGRPDTTPATPDPMGRPDAPTQQQQYTTPQRYAPAHTDPAAQTSTDLPPYRRIE